MMTVVLTQSCISVVLEEAEREGTGMLGVESIPPDQLQAPLPLRALWKVTGKTGGNSVYNDSVSLWESIQKT